MCVYSTCTVYIYVCTVYVLQRIYIFMYAYVCVCLYTERQGIYIKELSYMTAESVKSEICKAGWPNKNSSES